MIGLDLCLYGTLIYKKTGNLRAVQLLLGHTKIESTARYLGIEVDDALAVADQKSMSENRGRAEMLCLLIHGRFMPEPDIEAEIYLVASRSIMSWA